MNDFVLVLNVGSSSVNFALYPQGTDDAHPILRGKIAGIGTDPVLASATICVPWRRAPSRRPGRR